MSVLSFLLPHTLKPRALAGMLHVDAATQCNDRS